MQRRVDCIQYKLFGMHPLEMSIRDSTEWNSLEFSTAFVVFFFFAFIYWRSNNSRHIHIIRTFINSLIAANRHFRIDRRRDMRNRNNNNKKRGGPHVEKILTWQTCMLSEWQKSIFALAGAAQTLTIRNFHRALFVHHAIVSQKLSCNEIKKNIYDWIKKKRMDQWRMQRIEKLQKLRVGMCEMKLWFAAKRKSVRTERRRRRICRRKWMPIYSTVWTWTQCHGSRQ